MASSEPDANFWCSPFLHACSEHACGVERHHHIASGRHSHQATHAFGQTLDHHFFSGLSQRCVLVLHDSCNFTSHCGFHDGFAPSGCRDCAQVVGVVASPQKRSIPCGQKHYNIVRPCEPVTIEFYNLSLLENGQSFALHFTVAELEGVRDQGKLDRMRNLHEVLHHMQCVMFHGLLEIASSPFWSGGSNTISGDHGTSTSHNP